MPVTVHFDVNEAGLRSFMETDGLIWTETELRRVARIASESAPVDTGTLRDGITHEARTRGLAVTGSVTADTRGHPDGRDRQYAIYVERRTNFLENAFARVFGAIG